MPNKPEEQNAPKMISKGPNKQGMDWGPRSPIIYTSVTESDPDLKKPKALGIIDEDEVGLTIDHSGDQIVIDINDYRYTDQSVAIEKLGGKLRVLVWADKAGEPPYIIDFNETEPKEAK
jgi:hypothetical protein